MIGIDCSTLEVQELAWIIDRGVKRMSVGGLIQLKFNVHKYDPYADQFCKLLDS